MVRTFRDPPLMRLFRGRDPPVPGLLYHTGSRPL